MPVSKYSLSIWPDFPTENYVETFITGISGEKTYKLELWIKSKYPSGYFAIGTTLQGEFIESKRMKPDTFEALKKYILIDTLNTQLDDSITIRLSAGIVDLCTYECKPFFTKIDFREFDPTTLDLAENYKTDLIIVFPNPVREILNFKLNNQHLIEEIEVFSSGGKSVGSFNTNKIDVKDLSKGLYFYKLKLKGGIIKTGKFIKS